MRIFILGRSHVGKSPMAIRVAKSLGFTHVSASAWVRDRFKDAAAPETEADRAALVERMTSFAIDELKRDPAVSLANLRAHAPATACVIDGMRNPYDFVSSFDPRRDIAVFLDRPSTSNGGAFECGIDVIRDYLAWLVGVGMLDAEDVRELRFSDFGAPGHPTPDTLEAAIEDVIGWLLGSAQYAAHQDFPARGSLCAVHAQIPPIEACVRAEFLFDLDPAHIGELRRCTVFAISSYHGEAPTFQILLDDGALFSFVPAHALIDPSKASSVTLSMAELVYRDCRTTEICVSRFEELRRPVLAFIRQRDLWFSGDYLFTVDWHTGNEQLHLIALDNGQYALLPNHKLKFGHGVPAFAPYRKMRHVWRIGDAAP